MLIIMTYNVYLTGLWFLVSLNGSHDNITSGAVVFGAAFGYWLFTGLLCMAPFANTVKHKHALEQSASDACH